MNEKQAQLMRALTAAQAALWDVTDAPSGPGAKASRTILGILVGHVAELASEIVVEKSNDDQ